MAAVKLDSFGGMLPAVSRRLLPDHAASYAANTDLTTGEMRAIRYPAEIHVFGFNVKKAYRIPDPAAPETPVWKGMISASANLVRSPLVNDSFQRQIWIDGNAPGAPQRLLQNTLERIAAGNDPYLLGVPIPEMTPGVAVVGGSGQVLTRSYLFTYVNLFGEEGQPSPPGTMNGYLTGTWNISGLEAPADAAARGLTQINLYRSITASSGGTTFYRVAQLDISATDYADARTDADVASEGLIIASTPWREPEALEGFVQMPNGILAGWKGNQVFFSEPYRPWAWPAEYILSVRYEIMACAVIDQTLVVLTEGAPSFITGTTPASMTIADSPVVEPCISAHAITAGPDGVYYLSRNGLMVVNAGGINNATAALIEPKTWRIDYTPGVVGIGRFETQVLVFQANGRGYVIDGRDTRVALQRISGFNAVDNVWTDPYTGETHLAAGNVVYLWGSADAPFATALWRSKEFHLPKPVNLGAAIIELDSDYDADTVVGSVLPSTPPPPVGGPWDDLTNTIGYCRIFGATLGVGIAPGTIAPGNAADTAPWPNWPGVINYSTGFDAEESLYLPDGVLCVLNVYADRERVWSQAVETKTTYRLPSGFKSDVWQFSIVSRVPVYSLQVAETAKELAGV